MERQHARPDAQPDARPDAQTIAVMYLDVKISVATVPGRLGGLGRALWSDCWNPRVSAKMVTTVNRAVNEARQNETRGDG